MSKRIDLDNNHPMTSVHAPLNISYSIGLAEGKSAGTVKKFREAELKHGRVAMTAFLGIMTAESFNPLWNGKISGAAIYQFQQVDNVNDYFWVAILFGIALIEGQNILTGWESSAETGSRGSIVAELKEDYINGDLGFDPLSLTPADSDEFDLLRTKELNNGRLAMLGVAGIIAQELVNGKGVLENLGFATQLAVIQN
jgi:light-harvesting complex I chlorophyll a/b binding protein 1